uniref:Cytochrome-c oxidase n=1 Tax=Ascaris lumbricoides TaxID=6252 RepID=A0A0M3HLD0_ASCLU
MGIHTQGALPALVLPAILTSICYLGTWVMTYIDGHIGSLFGKRSFYTFLCYRMNLSDDLSLSKIGFRLMLKYKKGHGIIKF